MGEGPTAEGAEGAEGEEVMGERRECLNWDSLD